MKALYATGWNAWKQLDFGSSSTEDDEEVDDLYEFRCVLSDAARGERGSLEVVYLGLEGEGTVVRTSTGLHKAGAIDEQLLQRLGATRTETARLPPIVEAVAGNGRRFDTASDILSSHIPSTGRIRQLVAGTTHFVLLWEPDKADKSHEQKSEDDSVNAIEPEAENRVYTFGDPRFPACLAWDAELSNSSTTNEHPPHIPRIIDDLLNLPTGPIIKVVAGGYISAALTKGGDMYLWGLSASPSSSSSSTLPSSSSPSDAAPEFESDAASEKEIPTFELSAIPTPLDLDAYLDAHEEGEDVQDLAIGNGHIILLTTMGKVYVWGEGRNGQLGLGREVVSTNGRWIRVGVKLKEGERVVGVRTMARASLLLVDGGGEE